jgi:hypothetical protein
VFQYIDNDNNRKLFEHGLANCQDVFKGDEIPAGNMRIWLERVNTNHIQYCGGIHGGIHGGILPPKPPANSTHNN